MNKIKRIGVLTSGGDAPGMNAAVRAVARTALANGIECVGIRRGWQGLITSDFVPLTRESVGHILSRGGTILYTARSDEFMTEKGRLKAVATCKMLGLDAVVAIGGDGTFRGALELSRLGVPVVGVPATIDNDVGCTNYTIGFDTACNTAIECIDKLRDTMQSHERCSVVEVMGRNAGFLALYVGIAVGATAVLVPEHQTDFDRDVVERIRESRLAGNTHFMIVVAEGAGSAVEFGKKIHDALGMEPRVTVLGHIQRGGAPNARDRETATRMGYYAVNALVEGNTNCIIGTQEGGIVQIPIEEALVMKKHLQMDRYRIMEAMQFGGLYTNDNKDKAVLFAHRIQFLYNMKTPRIRLAGLDAKKNYRLRELNVKVGSKPSPLSGRVFTGKLLMEQGLYLPLEKDYNSCVFELTAE